MKTIHLEAEPPLAIENEPMKTAFGQFHLEIGHYAHGQRSHPLELQITQMECRALGYHAIEYNGYINLYDANNKLIGGLQLQRRWQMAKLFALWVDESHRSQGLGAMLMEKAETLAWEMGAKQIMLETSSIHHCGFYLAQGFEVLATLDDVIPDEMFYIMNKPIQRALQ